MTSLYGSKAMPRRIFGEGEKLDTFYDVMEKEASGIWALNEALLGLWQPTALSHDWVLPDNFHVKTKVMAEKYVTIEFLEEKHEIHSYENRPQAEGLSIGANVIHSIDGMVVREMLRRCTYNAEKLIDLMKLLSRPVVTQVVGEYSPHEELVKTLWSHYEKTGFLSVRILEVLDELNIHLVDQQVIMDMIKTLPDHPFDVLTVHDCFRVHPNYANDLRQQYNQILHDLAKSNVMASIASQICGEEITVSKYGDFSDQILEANYALS